VLALGTDGGQVGDNTLPDRIGTKLNFVFRKYFFRNHENFRPNETYLPIFLMVNDLLLLVKYIEKMHSVKFLPKKRYICART
jgi:hypothetical protein